MQIEKQKIQFHPQFVSEKWNLNDLQKQYLAALQGGDTIQELVIRFLQSGWLINFSELYNLIFSLVQKNVILNPDLKTYFSLASAAAPRKLQTVDDKSNRSQTIPKLAELLKLPFLRSLPTDLASALLTKAHLLSVPPETVICKQGDYSRDLFILLAGQAVIFKKEVDPKYASEKSYTINPSANQAHLQTGISNRFISVLNTNAVFGESAFLLGQPRSATISTTQASQVLQIPYQSELLEKSLNVEKAAKVIERFWIQQALANSDFFKKIPTDCLDALIFSGQLLNLKPNQEIFQCGDRSHAAYLVVQGQLQITQNGKLINQISQGGFIGEVSLIMTGGLRTANARSVQNSLVLEISRNNFYKTLSENLTLAKELQNLSYERLSLDQKRNL